MENGLLITSELPGMIWRKHANGLDIWSLEQTEPTHDPRGHSYCKCFGDVTKDFYKEIFRTLLPDYYNEETDGDARSVGEFDNLPAAMRAVEQNINRDLTW